MLDRLKNEPAVLFSLVEAGLGLALVFGLDLTAEQTAAVLAFVAILTGVTVRQPVAGPKTYANDIDAHRQIDEATKGNPDA